MGLPGFRRPFLLSAMSALQSDRFALATGLHAGLLEAFCTACEPQSLHFGEAVEAGPRGSWFGYCNGSLSGRPFGARAPFDDV